MVDDVGHAVGRGDIGAHNRRGRCVVASRDHHTARGVHENAVVLCVICTRQGVDLLTVAQVRAQHPTGRRMVGYDQVECVGGVRCPTERGLERGHVVTIEVTVGVEVEGRRKRCVVRCEDRERTGSGEKGCKVGAVGLRAIVVDVADHREQAAQVGGRGHDFDEARVTRVPVAVPIVVVVPVPVVVIVVGDVVVGTVFFVVVTAGRGERETRHERGGRPL